MILYHGSNVAVEHPRIIVSDRKLDFGSGFYLTSSRPQAERWAKLTATRRGSGQPLLSIFSFDELQQQCLNVKTFSKADASWLRYTAHNRRDADASDDYDLVIGPVADDNTYPVISLYFAGIYDEEEAIKRLLPHRLQDQYAFKTEKALSFLTLLEVKPL